MRGLVPQGHNAVHRHPVMQMPAEACCMARRYRCLSAGVAQPHADLVSARAAAVPPRCMRPRFGLSPDGTVSSCFKCDVLPQVGPKKQVREVRETVVASQGRNTPFGVAFRGVLAHHNRNPGKQESINLEPFTLLNVRPEIGPNGRDTVEAGLQRLCSRYRNPETGQEHRSLIAELPPVLSLLSPFFSTSTKLYHSALCLVQAGSLHV